VTAPRPLPDVLLEDVPDSGECVLVDPASGKILALNAAGAALWELLDGSRDATQLAEILAQAAELSGEQARADVDALLERLRREGFLLEAG
jgi:hypothetical protein